MKQAIIVVVVVVCALAIAPGWAGSSTFPVGDSESTSQAATRINAQAVSQPKSCQAIVSRAMDLLQSTCQRVGRNKACYGNLSVQAEAMPATRLQFNSVGDIANISDIRTLTTAPLDEEKG